LTKISVSVNISSFYQQRVGLRKLTIRRSSPMFTSLSKCLKPNILVWEEMYPLGIQIVRLESSPLYNYQDYVHFELKQIGEIVNSPLLSSSQLFIKGILSEGRYYGDKETFTTFVRTENGYRVEGNIDPVSYVQLQMLKKPELMENLNLPDSNLSVVRLYFKGEIKTKTDFRDFVRCLMFDQMK